MPVRAWVLIVPSRKLQYVEMSADTVSAIWDLATDSRGCVTFTYGIDGKFTATSGITFEL
jgi:hypothetical protein